MKKDWKRQRNRRVYKERISELQSIKNLYSKWIYGVGRSKLTSSHKRKQIQSFKADLRYIIQNKDGIDIYDLYDSFWNWYASKPKK